MVREEIYQVQEIFQIDQTDRTDEVAPTAQVPPTDEVSPRESLLSSDSNEYLELARLRTLSSGRYADDDSDYNDPHYYNFLSNDLRNGHSAPQIWITLPSHIK